MSDKDALQGHVSYCPEYYDALFGAEERHFWFRSRNRCIAAVARLVANGSSVRDIIEHGCGTGFVLAELQRLFPQARVVGADLFEEGLALARRRFSGPLVKLDILECDYREAFDLVGLFDVLEHLEDDLRVLRAIREQLRVGGHLLLTVPAHMMLWSAYDIASGHCRRYTRAQLLARLSEAGFEVRFCSEFMFALFPLMLVRRRLSWGRSQDGKTPSRPEKQMKSELKVHTWVNRLLGAILWPESWWLQRRRRLPAGTSLVALASRKA